METMSSGRWRAGTVGTILGEAWERKNRGGDRRRREKEEGRESAWE